MVNDLTIELIKECEGRKLKAYQCSAGVWTIGYGTTQYPTGHAVKEGDKITGEKAEELLLNDIKKCEEQVKALVTVPLNDNELGALVSFVYNLGAGKLKNSTLLKNLNAKISRKDVANEFDKWVYAGGKKLDGLVKRRAKEKALFLS